MARNRRNGEPLLALVGSWAVLGASFALSASTWILLAEIAGFTGTLSIPDTDVILSMTWLMPICVDGYVVVALTLWMSPVPAKVARFAKINTYVAAVFGIAAQSAYHLLTAIATATEDWQIALAAIVGALPPALAGLSIHMRALIRRESNRTGTEDTAVKPSRVAGLISTITQVRQAMATPVPTTVPVPVTSYPAASAAPVAATTQDTRTAIPVTPAMAPTASMPNPAQVADRITARPTQPARHQPESATAQRPTTPRRTNRQATATRPAPSSTDPQVAAKDAARFALPLADPALIARVAEVARQYHAEHGNPVTPGQLAVRLKVNTDHAAQLLKAIGDAPSTQPTVNGRPVKAAQ